MNLAIRGIGGNLGKENADSFHRDLHPDLKADYVIANPPFNMSDWGGERLREDKRWKYGAPPVGNANYAWIQHFIHHLAPNGTAGFVLANGSMSSNTSGEGEIRKAIIEDDLVDCMVALPGQLFFSTQIPVCLWFLTRNKNNGKDRDRRGETLFIDRWLDDARGILQNFPEFNAPLFLEWVTARRDLFACARPSPVHQDFHPGNILVRADDSAVVIDWTNFAVTDPRFDLAWTLVLAYAYSGQTLRDQIFSGYQHHAGKQVEQIEAFEAIVCARRLLDLTISLTQGAQRMGMNAQAVEAMRANMEAHRRVHRLLIERTGLQIEIFTSLFGNSG